MVLSTGVEESTHGGEKQCVLIMTSMIAVSLTSAVVTPIHVGHLLLLIL